jgi:autotransporter-associated beta strand protein
MAFPASRAFAALVAAPFFLALPAKAQSTWQGATSAYGTAGNWDNNTPPTAAGQAAIFAGTGTPSIAVTGTIAPDSWTFSSAAQSYAITGGTVNFGTAAGLTNNASGRSISVGSNLGGTGGLAMHDATGTLILSGNNSYSGATVIDSGAILRAGSNTAFSQNSSFTINGTLDLGNFSNRITSLSGNGTITTSGSVGILSFAPTGTITFAGSITNGAGTVAPRFDGSGTTILTGANSFSGTVNLNSGTLQIGNGGATGTLGTGSIIDSAALVFNRSGTLSVAGAISGTGSVTQAGSGTTILTRNNSWSGAATISAGTLQIGNGGTTGSLGTNAVTNNGALVFNRSNTATVTNAVSGTGTLTQAGAGTIILTGANTYGGITTISAGTLQIGNGGTTGSLGTGNVTDNATLAFNRSDTITVANAISGTGALTQTGTGTTILAGTNSYGGATTVSGGTLKAGSTTAFSQNSDFTVTTMLDLGGFNNAVNSLSGSGTVTNSGASPASLSLAGNAGTSFSGTIQDGSQSLALTLTGGGTLILSGSNSYSGTTTISSGVLQIGNGGTGGTLGSGNVVNNAGLVFDRSDTVTVANAISGSGNLNQVGSGTIILTGANSYGMTSINSGTLQIGNGGTTGVLGSGNVVNNGALVFNRSDTLAVANTISGSGGLTQAGGGNLILTGASTYTGPTIINGGTLSVTGSIAASAVTVNSGGRLGGTGTTGAVTVNGGGTIAPGNSIGTLTVASLSLAPGSATSMELSPTAADRINVTGNASLGGVLALSPSAGSYGATSYRLIQAGNIDSTFANVTGSVPGFTNTVQYSATAVDFILSTPPEAAPAPAPPPPGESPAAAAPAVAAGPVDTTRSPAIEPPPVTQPPIPPPAEITYLFGSYGKTQDQIAAGDALTAGSPTGALYTATGALVTANTAAVSDALGQLAGDIRPSLRAAAIEDSRIIRDTLLDHMHAGGEGTAVWGAGLGGYGRIAGDGNAEGLHHDSAGFLAGADFDVLPGLRLGVAAGYSSNRARTASRLSTASGDARHVGAYTDWRSGDFRVDAGGEYGFGTVRVARVIGPLGFANSGSQDQQTGQIFADAGYRIAFDSAALQPHATLAHVIASSGAFTESGDISALSGGGANESQTYTLLGLRGALPGLKLDDMDLTPRLDVGWQHALTQFAPGQTVTLANANQSFPVLGAPLTRDAANVQAGFDLTLGAATLFVAYDGSFAATNESHAFRGGLNWQF